jgi:deoxycytidylate deaminase
LRRRLGLGITGSFGSGCSTICDVIENNYSCKKYSLSDTLKQQWSKINPGKPYTKEQLQDLGNSLRRDHGLDFLAKETYKRVVSDKNTSKDIVFDSIRNPNEIDFLRTKFHNFYVIAVDCAESDRWERIKNKEYISKGLDHDQFSKDDSRDKNEDGIIYGQQVSLCVDQADYLLRNDTDTLITSLTAIKRVLKRKLDDPMGLFQGNTRTPKKVETYMSIAFTASLMSECVKRQVGAVIIDKMGHVVSVGYNMPPRPLSPCYKQFGDCFREIVIARTMENVTNCPVCKKTFESIHYPYTCPNPECKTNVYKKIISDRAIGRCMSLHAEEEALANTQGQDLSSCVLYVTTFPCFHCTQKILDAGISRFCYVESYPDLDAVKLFALSKQRGKDVKIQQFEGVKARAYIKLFGNWRSRRESELDEARRKV